MSTLVPVAADLAGLEHFAYALFAQAAGAPLAEPPGRLAAAALDPERIQEATDTLETHPDIPLAYRLWLAHLVWLEEVLHTLDCRPAEVTAAELAGLQALARARARFLRAYEFCPRCQTAGPRGAGRCRRCRTEY